MTNASTEGYTPRRILKNVAESLVSSFPRRTGAGSLVLAYHNVVATHEAGFGDTSLHVPIDAFSSQLRTAKGEGDLVDLPTLMRELDRPGRRIAVTFDDAYSGCLQFGVPACSAEGVVPTVFVAGRLLGTVPPWDRAAEGGCWTESDRSRFLVDQAGRELVPLAPEAAERLPPTYRIAELSQLRTLLESYPVHLGNHSVSHANLAALSDDELKAEVAGGHALLSEFAKRRVPYLAYPYGKVPSSRQRGLLHEFCDGAFRVDGGWLPRGRTYDRLQLPRLNVPAGLSVAGFRCKLRGWT